MSRKWFWCWMVVATVALARLSPWCAVPAVILLGGLLIRQWVDRVAGDARLRWILFGSYGLQVLVTLGLYVASAKSWPLWASQQLGYGFWQFAIDAASYHINALRMLDAFWAHQPLPADIAAPEFVLLLTAGYTVVGPAPLLLCLLNAWLRVAAALFAYSLGSDLLDKQAGQRAALLVAFWPSLFIWSSQLLREMLCLTLLFGILCGMASLWQASRARFKGVSALAVLGLEVVLLTQVRWYLALLLFAASLSVCVVAGVQRALFHRPGVQVAAQIALTVMLAFGVGHLEEPLRWLPTVLPRPAVAPQRQARAPEGAPSDRTTEGANGARPAPLLSVGISPTSERQGSTGKPVGSLLTGDRVKTARSRGALAEGAPFSALNSEMLALWQRLQLSPRIVTAPSASQDQRRDEPSELGTIRLQFASWRTWRLFSWVASRKAENLYGTRRASLERAHTLIAPEADTNTTHGLLMFLPQGIVAAMLSPWPTQWFDAAGFNGVLKGWSSFEVLLIYLLLPSILIGLGEAFRRLRPVPLGMAVFSFLGLSFLSLTVASVGVVFRLRLSFLLPLAVLGCAVDTPSRWLWYRWRLPTIRRGRRPSAKGSSARQASAHSTSQTPVRIMRILTRMNIGGPAIHAALLSTRLDRNRFETCLVVGQSETTEGDLGELVQGRVVRLPTLRRPIRPWMDALTLVHLLLLLWRERPQILHTHMAKAGALGRFAGHIYNTVGPGRQHGSRLTIVHTFHGHVLDGYFSAWQSSLFVRIERWLARHTDCLIAVSPAIREVLLEKGIGRPEQWRVIRLGLDLADLARLPLPESGTPVRLGMVGRLVPIKNPGLFLEAVRQAVERRNGPLRGVIIGDGSLRKHLEDEVRRLGLEEVVRFTGWQQDLRTVYGGLDAVCLTSWNEGTPVALIEAMAAGRAVVATDVGGVRDLLDDGGAQPPSIAKGGFRVTARGVLVQPGDAAGLAAALQAVAADGNLRRRLGAAARTFVVQRFSAERLCRDMKALYADLTERPAGRSG